MRFLIQLISFILLAHSVFAKNSTSTIEPLPLETESNSPSSIANFTSVPNGIVNGCVNVITGDFFDSQPDLYIEGPEPLVVRRFYSSSDCRSGTLLNGWHLSYQGKIKEVKEKPPLYPETPRQRPRVRDRNGELHEHPQYDSLITPNTKKADSTKHYASFVGPMGIKYSFRRTKDHDYIFTQEELKYGVTNCFGPEISARTNLKNNRFNFNEVKKNPSLPIAVLQEGNNNRFYFQKANSENCYLVKQEERPSLNKINYEYDKKDRLKTVRMANPQNVGMCHFTLDWPETIKDKSVVTLKGSDNKKVTYEFIRKKSHVYTLQKVLRPDAPWEHFSYSESPRHPDEFVITRKERPNRRAIEMSYYKKGNNDVGPANVSITDLNSPLIGRIKSLRAPVGHDATLYETHRFYYFFENGKLGAGTCGVHDIHGTKTDYRWNDNLQLTHVTKFNKQGRPYTTEHLEWEDFNSHSKTNIKSRSLIGAGAQQYKITYLYDGWGNVPEEIFEGNIRGIGTTDRYVKKRRFHEDALHLKHFETDDIITKKYQYKPNTDLLTACFTLGDGRMQSRQFFDYDVNNACYREIVDDGQGYDRNDLSGVTCRKIRQRKFRGIAPHNLPEIEDEKCVDLSTGREILLHRVVNSYTADGKLVKQDHYDSNCAYIYSLSWEYDAMGNVIGETNPLGQRTVRRYDENCNCVFEQSAPYICHKEFHYDYSNRLVREDDVHADGVYSITYDYNGLSQLAKKVDSFGNETHYAYDEFGRLISTRYAALSDCNGQLYHPQIHTEYDVLGYPTQKTDARGHKTQIRCTVQGKPYFIQYADGSVERFEYDILGRLSKKTAKNGTSTVYTYDCLGRTTKVDSYSSSGEYLYSTSAVYGLNLLSETDAEGHITRYDYDYAGRLIKQTRDEQVITYEYDSRGRLFRKKTWGDSPIIYETNYDNLDRIICEKILNVYGEIQRQTSYAYDESGNRTQVIAEIDGQIAKTETAYDSHRQPILITDPEGNQTRFIYNYRYRNTCGQTVFYKEEVDPLGNSSVTILDTHGQVATLYSKDTFGNVKQERQFSYDPNGNLVQTIDLVHAANQDIRKVINRWEHNSSNQLITQIEAHGTPEQKVISHAYNNFNQKVSTTKADGVTIFYAYDSWGRLQKFSSSDNSFSYVYTYDRLSNVLQVEDQIQNTLTKRIYDVYGNLSAETLANGTTLNYDSDPYGNLKTLTLPDQSQAKYVYDGANLKEVHRKGNVHQYTYDNSGNVTQSDDILVKYDKRGLTTAIEHPHWRAQYSYDAVGNLSSATIPNGKTDYDYDPLYQLRSENGVANHQYENDSLYNRIKKDDEVLTYNSLNQITQVGETGYSYDANGNLLEDGSAEYAYDALDRLISVVKNGEKYSYIYDAFNRRMSKITPHGKINYLYQGQNEIGAVDANGKITELRILGVGRGAEIGAAVFVELDGVQYKPVHDMQGNLVCLVKDDNAVVTYAYTAFGELLNDPDALNVDLCPWRFSSKRVDPETDFLYFGRRYYSPRLGRWITPDPIGFDGGPNLYAYVCNNPLSYFDLYGLETDGPHSMGGIAFEQTARNPSNTADRDGRDFIRYTEAFYRGARNTNDHPDYFIAKYSGVVGCVYNSLFHEEICLEQKAHPISEQVTSNVGEVLAFNFNISTENKGYAIGELPLVGVGKIPATACVRKVAEIVKRTFGSWFGKALCSKKAFSSLGQQVATKAMQPVRHSGYAESFVGSRGNQYYPTKYQPFRNSSYEINGRLYSGHALDQMQNRGIPISVVENTIQSGSKFIGKKTGTTAFYEPINNITVIIDSKSGDIITTTHGLIKQGN